MQQISTYVLNCILFLAVTSLLALLASFVLERRRLRRWILKEVDQCLNDHDQALHAAALLCASIRRRSDPHFLAKLLSPLGASPLTVLEFGGCCSGIHRLFIASLQTIGITAAQITLYHRHGHAQHCLVEVRIGDSPIIVDVDYGVFYTHKRRMTLSLEDLQGGITPEHVLIPKAGRAGYPVNDYYDFDYRLTKTANWTKSAARRLAYRLFHWATDGAVDRWRLHPLLEWPQVLLSLSLAPLIVLLAVTRFSLS